MRVPVAVAMCVGVFAVCAGPAAAETTFDQAAATVRFPVWKPARTLHLEATVNQYDCGYGKVPEYVAATYRKPHAKKLFSLWQAYRICGNPDEAQPVKVVRIHGRKAYVSVICGHDPCPGIRLKDGRSHGWIVSFRMPARKVKGVKRATTFQAIGHGLTLREFLRVLRSLHPVNLDRPRVQLTEFLSSDGSVWCGTGLIQPETYRWCSTYEPQYGGFLHHDGTLDLCGAGRASPWDECRSGWGYYAPRLRDGQTSAANGFVCTDAAGAITCTITGGKGFHVDADGSEALP